MLLVVLEVAVVMSVISSSSGCTIRAHTGGDGARGFCRSLTISLTLTILAEVSLGSASEGGGGVMDF